MSRPVVSTACLIAAAASVVSTGRADAATLLGPTPYACQADSPFPLGSPGYMLETFEDGLFNTPGVTASVGGVIGPGGNIDSVDCDDGAVNGSGAQGHSFFFLGGPTGITFTFDAAILNGLPTSAGIVWTDGGFGCTVTFQAFDGNGISLGVVGPVALGDGSNNGTTGEDRFFGVTNPAGVKSIHISNNAGGIEVDHLQFGPVFPCLADIAPSGGGDGQVNIDDLFTVINAWGACVACAADISPSGGDGQVNIDDLFAVINAWGPCS